MALVCKMGSACTHPSDTKDAEFSVNEADPGASKLGCCESILQSAVVTNFADILRYLVYLFICVIYVIIFLHFMARRDAREIRLV